MDSSTVIRRTQAGAAELAAPAHGLSLAQRRFLTLLDTPASGAELAARHAVDPGKLERDVARLVREGFIECVAPVRSGAGAAETGSGPSGSSAAAQAAGASGARAAARLGAPRFSRKGPLAALVVAFAALAWVGWHMLTQPASSPPSHDQPRATTVAGLVGAAAAREVTELGVIATRTLRGDPAERSRDAVRASRPTTAPSTREPPSQQAPVAPPAAKASAAALGDRVDEPGRDEPAVGPSDPAAPRPPAPAPTPALPASASDPKTAAPPKAATPVSAAPAIEAAAASPTTPSTPERPAEPTAAPAQESTAPPVPPVPAPVSAAGGASEARGPGAATVRLASNGTAAGLLRSSPSPLRPIARETPEFPREAIAQGIDRGNVRARVTVDAQGRVSGVDIVETSHRAFDRAVRSALSRWQFEPGASGRATTVDVAFKRD